MNYKECIIIWITKIPSNGNILKSPLCVCVLQNNLELGKCLINTK